MIQRFVIIRVLYQKEQEIKYVLDNWWKEADYYIKPYKRCGEKTILMLNFKQRIELLKKEVVSLAIKKKSFTIYFWEGAYEGSKQWNKAGQVIGHNHCTERLEMKGI